MQDLVSIVIPVYKAEDYIEETINNIRSQTYRQWELILVCDNSPDRSSALIKEACGNCLVISEREEEYRIITHFADAEGRNIYLVENHVDGSAAKARNAGIELAGGRYLCFLDADDKWIPEKLTKQIAFMKEKDAAFSFTSYEFGDQNANPTGKIVKAPQTLSYKEALSRTVIFTSTVMFDLWKLGKEAVMMPLVESEDTATWWRVLRSGVTAYGLDEVLSIYRRPARSLSSNKFKAMSRIWKLYRQQEKLGVFKSAGYFMGWAVRATLRRL